jgi:hypothetical protein
LDAFFGDLAFYGILKDVNTQCLKSDIKLEPTFYLFSVAMLALSLINFFIKQAVLHYFDDIHSAKLCEDTTPSENHSILEVDGYKEMSAKALILPVPIMFTDRYRWVLHREDMTHSMISRQKSVTLPSSQSGPQFTW